MIQHKHTHIHTYNGSEREKEILAQKEMKR